MIVVFCGVVVMLAHMWAHVLHRGIAGLICSHGTLKEIALVKTALQTNAHTHAPLANEPANVTG